MHPCRRIGFQRAITCAALYSEFKGLPSHSPNLSFQAHRSIINSLKRITMLYDERHTSTNRWDEAWPSAR